MTFALDIQINHSLTHPQHHLLPHISPHCATTTSCTGLSFLVRTFSIFFTTSMPSTTRPKTTCLPSSHGVATVVTKNWLPLVFGPEFWECQYGPTGKRIKGKGRGGMGGMGWVRTGERSLSWGSGRSGEGEREKERKRGTYSHTQEARDVVLEVEVFVREGLGAVDTRRARAVAVQKVSALEHELRYLQREQSWSALSWLNYATAARIQNRDNTIGHVVHLALPMDSGQVNLKKAKLTTR